MNPSEMTPPSQPLDGQPAQPPYPPPQEAFLILIITLAASFLGGIVFLKLDRTGLFLTELIFIVPPIIYLRRKGYNLRRCLRWNAVPIVLLVAAFFIGISLTVLLDELDRLINLFYPMPEELQKVLLDFMQMKTWTDYLIVGFGAIVAAGFCEESLFRGFIQVSMEAHGPVTRAVLFSGLLFAIAHFNPWWMMQILILGVVLGYLSWRADSAIPGMLIHGLNNGLALFSGGDLQGDRWAWYNMGDHVAPWILIAASALLFLGFKLFVRLTEHSFASKSEPPLDRLAL